jgi:transcriptional regulator with XRE-family HTH domain
MQQLGRWFGGGDNPLAGGYSFGMQSLSDRLGHNIKLLREARGMTQHQIAKVAGMPRATWANLESGDANPTLSVLDRVAFAFQVSLEELIASPRAEGRRYSASELRVVSRGAATIRKLLPDPIPGMELDRFELPPGVRMTGVPHTPGTREYLTCETGTIVLVAGGAQFDLGPGDVVAFRGDQRHSYTNPGAKTAVAYSVVVLAPRSA